MCGALISEDYLRTRQRLPSHERNLVQIVTTIGMKTTIMKQGVLRGDDLAKLYKQNQTYQRYGGLGL